MRASPIEGGLQNDSSDPRWRSQEKDGYKNLKIKFVAGVQCLKRLYWQVHQPELASEPEAAVEAIMEQGQEVGPACSRLVPQRHGG